MAMDSGINMLSNYMEQNHIEKWLLENLRSEDCVHANILAIELCQFCKMLLTLLWLILSKYIQDQLDSNSGQWVLVASALRSPLLLM